jgi:hypothetical protein
MGIIRRLKDTLRTYDEIRLQQRIIGRRILSNKILCLPFNQSWSMNFYEISRPSTSVRTEKRMNNDDQYDVKQSKLKNMMIDELKSVFISRNQQQDNDINSAPILTEKYSIASKKKIVQHSERITTSNKGKQ